MVVVLLPNGSKRPRSRTVAVGRKVGTELSDASRSGCVASEEVMDGWMDGMEGRGEERVFLFF